jgi:GTP-binding protein HflX
MAELRHLFPDAMNISAVTGFGMEDLLQKCSEVMSDRVRRRRYRIPQCRADLMGMLHRDAKVLSTDYEENDILVTAVVPAAIAGRLESFAC